MKEWIASNYAVVYCPSIEKLFKEVQKLIADGWKPQGESRRATPAFTRRWFV